MRWPWGNAITQTQAIELGKFLLTLCHTTTIGSVGYLFISQVELYKKMFVAFLGMFVAFILFLFAMRILRGVRKEI